MPAVDPNYAIRHKAKIAAQKAEFANILLLSVFPIALVLAVLYFGHLNGALIDQIYDRYEMFVLDWPGNIIFNRNLRYTHYSAHEIRYFLVCSYAYGLSWTAVITIRFIRELTISNDLYIPPLFLLKLILLIPICLLTPPFFGFLNVKTLFGFSYYDSIEISIFKMMIYQFGGYFLCVFTLNVGFLCYRSRRSRGKINRIGQLK